MFGTHDGPGFLQMLKELGQWVYTSRQGAGGLSGVVWALQSMEQTAQHLEEQLLKLAPAAGSPAGGDAHQVGSGPGAQCAVQCYGEGDPSPVEPIIAACAEAPRTRARALQLLEQLDEYLEAAVQTGWPAWHVGQAAGWLKRGIGANVYYFEHGTKKNGA